MKFETTLASAVVVAALSLSPLAANGQERNNGHQRGGGRANAGQPAQREGGGGGGRQAVSRQAREAAPQAAPRQSENRQSENRQSAAPPAQRPSENRQYGGQAAPRASENRQYGSQQAPRAYGQPAPPARGGYRQAVPREQYYGSPAYRPGNGNHYGNRGYAYRPPSYYYARPYHGHVYARPYGWTAYRPYYFARPYYSFRPWFSIGFGLSIGYPVPYPYTYLGSYQPRVYGYYPNAYPYNVTPGVSVYGGVSFDIQPSDADVWVDDEYVGTVGTFTPQGEPLTLTPGQHHIVVQRDGFRAMEWDVTIEPGQVIPYRGAMQRF